MQTTCYSDIYPAYESLLIMRMVSAVAHFEKKSEMTHEVEAVLDKRINRRKVRIFITIFFQSHQTNSIFFSVPIFDKMDWIWWPGMDQRIQLSHMHRPDRTIPRPGDVSTRCYDSRFANPAPSSDKPYRSLGAHVHHRHMWRYVIVSVVVLLHYI